MKTKHTPAPWNYNEMATVVAGDVHDSNATCVSSLRHAGFGDKNVHNIDEVMANGHLIAAAPDLLAALKALFRECAMVHKHWGENCNQAAGDAAVTQASAAIAKAEAAQ